VQSMRFDPTKKMPFGTSLATFVAAPPSNGPDAARSEL
jgi:hypothetical protein